MKKIISIASLVALALFLSASGSASAATLYVGPDETYSEIQPALNAASNGDTIIVRDGTYTGAGGISGSSDEELSFS